MADDTLDDDLLALAGDDSDSPQEDGDPNPVPSPKRSDTPDHKSTQEEQASTHTSPSPAPQTSSESVTKRKAPSKLMKAGNAKRVKSDSQDDERPTAVESPAESLGSGAMSESENEEAQMAKSSYEHEDKRPFPVEGRFRSLQDKAEIMALPEASREQILSERMEEVDRGSFARTLKQHLQSQQSSDINSAQKKRKEGPELDSSPRKVTRQKTKATQSLEAYKRQREQRNEQRRRDGDRRDNDKLSPSADQDESDGDADAEDDNDVDWDDKPVRSSSPMHDEAPLEIGHLSAVKVGRTAFAKHCFTPGFDAAMKGVFIRAAVGPRHDGQMDYRIVCVKEVITGKPYLMEGSNKQPFQTEQYLAVTQGKFEKIFPFTNASDGQFTDKEFDRWKRVMAESEMSLPRPTWIQRKFEELTAVVNHVWTDSEISAKLKRGRVEFTKNAAINRNRLNAERMTALYKNDEAEVARIDKELAFLNGAQAASGAMNNISPNGKADGKKPPSQQDRLAAVNSRHRRENYEEIRKAQIAEQKAERKARLAVERGEAVANPFARVKTRPKVVHDFDENGRLVVPKLKGNDDLFESSGPSRAGTPQPGVKAAANGAPKPKEPRKFGTFSKKKDDDDFAANMDFGIDIDLDLE
ncbi:MAG: hypothetical protein M1828_000825 [Chrysothrix sp. TS-e1954]|nr:MAG: hypothetical protein M1828_000825 [Chrysothrix sp. TS-e1954]